MKEEMTDTDTYSDEISCFRKWKDFITIEPLESSEAYRIMEYFVDNLPKGHAKNILNNAINGKKPFAISTILFINRNIGNFGLNLGIECMKSA
jgi:hypothetical protein